MDLLLALLPALIMITLVIMTRRVLLALSVGVVMAAFIYAEGHAVNTMKYLFDSFYGIATSLDWYLPILAFVVLIGGVTSVLTLIGGVRAFASWSVSKVKNPVASEILTWVLGIIICIDDYFNALVIGEISIPITDSYKVSRAKLSYIIDSTSAPVVIMMPLSTWGAYIIGTMGGLFEDEGYTLHSGFSGFLAAVPFQFYPMTALIMVILTVVYRRHIGAMKHYEGYAEEDDSKLDALEEEMPEEKDTGVTHWALIVTVGSLVLMTLFVMIWNAGFDMGDVLSQDITIPLFFGGLTSFIVALVFAFIAKNVSPGEIFKTASMGIGAMAKSAVLILVLAWMVSGAIQDLDAGSLIADAIASVNFSTAIIPAVMFLVAGGLAFATGTSWGAFGILLPIAVPIAVSTDPTIMPVLIAAVLGGAVFGDHSSPVSDTTVLSATGAGAKLHAHFISQLPYAIMSALIATVAYLVYGLSGVLMLAYAVMILGLFLYVKLTKAHA
ncbi:MAG: Na+/H+ antiporter NhaC family protein [Candidatus Izemoplasmataceae bacterium]